MDGLQVGDIVQRVCEGTIGDGSIGEIYQISDTCYWIKILEGRGKMRGWNIDAWAKNWCVPIDLVERESDWEV